MTELVNICAPADAPKGALLVFDPDAPGHCRWTERPITIAEGVLDPAAIVIEALERKVAQLAAQVTALTEARATARPAMVEQSDLPTFLRKATPRVVAASATSFPGSPISDQVGAAIDAMHDIENLMQSRIAELTERVHDISRRLDMPALPLTHEGSGRAIETIEDWLRMMDARAVKAEADASAAGVEIGRLKEDLGKLAAEKRVSQGERLSDEAESRLRQAEESYRVALQDHQKRVEGTLERFHHEIQRQPRHGQQKIDNRGVVEKAIDRIKAAGAARRNASIGGTADARDVRQRLTEVGLNAGSGHERSLGWLGQMAEVQGLSHDELRRLLVERHDAATRLVVETACIESASVMKVLSAAPDEASAIADEAVRRIEMVVD